MTSSGVHRSGSGAARSVRRAVALGFGLGALLGALAQRTHFCVMGAISDAALLGERARLRQWVLAIAVALLGFNAMVAMGWLSPAQTIYGGRQLLWLSQPVGGLVDGCRDAGLLVLSAGEKVLRLTPPLVVGEAECDRALEILDRVLPP